MIERVVENWLTSANERQYQLPFCQLLAAEGETIVHISSHGQLEQGKDVISIGVDLSPRAYQLKSGPLRLTEWRRYREEILELVEYDIRHPSINPTARHLTFLVTNGEVTDPVLRAIESANMSWRRRKFPELRLITKGELLARFVRLHGNYLPKDPPDFQVFLQLYLATGKGPLDKEQFTKFLEKIIPLDRKPEPSRLEIQRFLASAVLLTSYVLHSPALAGNHWALFEAWTIIGAYTLAIATKFKLPKKHWQQTFQLCELAASRALSDLSEECSSRGHFIEGDALTDGHFYRERVTLLSGLLSAHDLYHQIKRQENPQREFIRKFVQSNVSRIRLWGESAVPFIAETALELAKSEQGLVAENLVGQVIKAIAETNGRDKGPGLPNPYYGPEQCVRIGNQLEETEESFSGVCYTLPALIDFLARRLRRRLLKFLWYDITSVRFLEHVPRSEWGWFMWKCADGLLHDKSANRPQSWSELLQAAENVNLSGVPKLLTERPEFLLFFILVYPHRFNQALFKILEDSLAEA